MMGLSAFRGRGRNALGQIVVVLSLSVSRIGFFFFDFVLGFARVILSADFQKKTSCLSRSRYLVVVVLGAGCSRGLDRVMCRCCLAVGCVARQELGCPDCLLLMPTCTLEPFLSV